MLNHLFVRNFTIVEQLELDFASGLTALTGETGAGKSILLDALGLALGDRGSADSVRAGADCAEISAGFDLSSQPAIRAWLEQHDLGADADCRIRRLIHANGRSKGYINGHPVALQQLKSLGEQLLDIHGQHAHQSLLRRDNQRALLDHQAGNSPLLADIEAVHLRLRALEAEIAAAGGDPASRDARRELLGYQLNELDALDLSQATLEQIDQEHRRLANAGTLIATANQTVELLSGEDGSIQVLLHQAERLLQAELGKEPGFGEALDLLAEAGVNIDEAGHSLQRCMDTLELDPARLQVLDEMLRQLADLARKHRSRPEELEAVRESLRDEHDRLDNQGARLQTLEAERIDLLRRYGSLAAALRSARRSAAGPFAAAVTAAIATLGMQHAALRVLVEPLPDDSTGRHGRDTVRFEVRSNPGQPFAPLQKIASGGELSRISLAIQVTASDAATIPTLIFDEADVGIGGRVAETVGRQLRELGRHHQVLCVTHLPQVASQAHHHLQVSKQTVADDTQAQVRVLDAPDRIEEIARMLGGVDITEATRRHAREMLERAQASDREPESGG